MENFRKMVNNFPLLVLIHVRVRNGLSLEFEEVGNIFKTLKNSCFFLKRKEYKFLCLIHV